MSSLDFFPMFCKLTGTALPRDIAFDGEDLTEAWSGKNLSRQKPLFWEYGRNNIGFDFPRIPRDRSPNLAMREGKWKLLVNADGSGLELYDLDADRNETENLAATNPETANRLKDMLLNWRKSLP